MNSAGSIGLSLQRCQRPGPALWPMFPPPDGRKLIQIKADMVLHAQKAGVTSLSGRLNCEKE